MRGWVSFAGRTDIRYRKLMYKCKIFRENRISNQFSSWPECTTWFEISSTLNQAISINFQGKFLTLLCLLFRKEESFRCSLLFRPLEFTFIIQVDQWVCEYFRRLVISIYVSLPSFFLLLLTFVWKYMFDIHFIFILHFK